MYVCVCVHVYLYVYGAPNSLLPVNILFYIINNINIFTNRLIPNPKNKKKAHEVTAAGFFSHKPSGP